MSNKISVDVFGNAVVVGDKVAYVTPKYHELKIGIVTKVTPCGMTIDKKVNRASYQVALGTEKSR